MKMKVKIKVMKVKKNLFYLNFIVFPANKIKILYNIAQGIYYAHTLILSTKCLASSPI